MGSVLVFPEEREKGTGGYGEELALKQLRFQELKPARKYMASLFTESNSGSISPVLATEAETHAEAPLVRHSGFLVTSDGHRSMSYRTTHFSQTCRWCVSDSGLSR